MKSEQRSDEIVHFVHDEIKSVLFNPAKPDLIHGVDFICEADLTLP
jgi:hypothetical protein